MFQRISSFRMHAIYATTTLAFTAVAMRRFPAKRSGTKIRLAYIWASLVCGPLGLLQGGCYSFFELPLARANLQEIRHYTPLQPFAMSKSDQRAFKHSKLPVTQWVAHRVCSYLHRLVLSTPIWSRTIKVKPTGITHCSYGISPGLDSGTPNCFEWW